MTGGNLAGDRAKAKEDGRNEAAETTKVGKPDAERTPNPAGPHSKPDLTDESKTPGSGMLSEPDDSNEAPSG